MKHIFTFVIAFVSTLALNAQVAAFTKYYQVSDEQLFHLRCENKGNNLFVMDITNLSKQADTNYRVIRDTFTDFQSSNYYTFKVRESVKKAWGDTIVQLTLFPNFISESFRDVSLHFALQVVSNTPTGGKLELKKKVIIFPYNLDSNLAWRCIKDTSNAINGNNKRNLKATYRDTIYKLDNRIKERITSIDGKMKKSQKGFDAQILGEMAGSLNYKLYLKRKRNLFSQYINKKWFLHTYLAKLEQIVDSSSVTQERYRYLQDQKDKNRQIMKDSIAALEKLMAYHNRTGDSISKMKQDLLAKYEKQLSACKISDSDCNTAKARESYDAYKKTSVEYIRKRNELYKYRYDKSLVTNDDPTQISYNAAIIDSYTQKLEHAIDSLNRELDDSPISRCIDQRNQCDTKLEKINKQIDELGSDLSWLTGGLSTLPQKIAELRKVIETDSVTQAKLTTSIDSLKNSIKNDNVMDFDSVQIEFEGGTIKHIVVSGIYNDERRIFINNEPIPFSALLDLSLHRNYFLYDVYNQATAIPIKSIVFYTPHLHTRSEDYAPLDTVVVIKPEIPSRVMTKEPTRELLRAKIFTDFMGYLNETPNGLVQTEVSKKINLFARYYKYIRPRFGYLDWRSSQTSYVGWFNYYFPSLTWSKIENKNRALQVLYTDTMVYYGDTTVLLPDTSLVNGKPIRYVPALELLRYSYLTIKPLNFNILSLHFPVIKSSFHVDLGGAVSLTELQDSITTIVDTVTTRVTVDKYQVASTWGNAEVSWMFLPDPRFNMSFSINFIWYKLWSKQFSQAGDPDLYRNHFDKRSGYHGILNPSFNVSYKPFKAVDGEIYFRFSYYTMLNDLKQNFMQTQLGLAFRFLK